MWCDRPKQLINNMFVFFLSSETPTKMPATEKVLIFCFNGEFYTIDKIIGVDFRECL